MVTTSVAQYQRCPFFPAPCGLLSFSTAWCVSSSPRTPHQHGMEALQARMPIICINGGLWDSLLPWCSGIMRAQLQPSTIKLGLYPFMAREAPCHGAFNHSYSWFPERQTPFCQLRGSGSELFAADNPRRRSAASISGMAPLEFHHSTSRRVQQSRQRD